MSWNRWCEQNQALPPPCGPTAKSCLQEYTDPSETTNRSQEEGLIFYTYAKRWCQNRFLLQVRYNC